MKYFAIAALLGLINAQTNVTTKVFSLQSTQDEIENKDTQIAYATHSTKQAEGRPPYQSAVRI